jgi:hypothetical protein
VHEITNKGKQGELHYVTGYAEKLQAFEQGSLCNEGRKLHKDVQTEQPDTKVE